MFPEKTNAAAPLIILIVPPLKVRFREAVSVSVGEKDPFTVRFPIVVLPLKVIDFAEVVLILASAPAVQPVGPGVHELAPNQPGLFAKS